MHAGLDRVLRALKVLRAALEADVSSIQRGVSAEHLPCVGLLEGSIYTPSIGDCKSCLLLKQLIIAITHLAVVKLSAYYSINSR